MRIIILTNNYYYQQSNPSPITSSDENDDEFSADSGDEDSNECLAAFKEKNQSETEGISEAEIARAGPQKKVSVQKNSSMPNTEKKRRKRTASEKAALDAKKKKALVFTDSSEVSPESYLMTFKFYELRISFVFLVKFFLVITHLTIPNYLHQDSFRQESTIEVG